MYELLALQPAFPGTDDKEILAAIIARDPTPLRKLVPTLPAELETICQKTLEKLPDARYATARDLAEDLRRFLNDLPIVAKRPGLLNRSLKYARRHRALTVGVVAILLIVTTVGFGLRERKKGAEERRRAIEARVESFVADGDREHATENWNLAAQSYEEAIALDPNNVPALANLAIVKKEQYNASLPNADPKLLDEAVSLSTRVLAIDPTRTRAWNTKGVALKMQGKLDEAADAYGKATKLSPKDPYTWANLAAINVLRRQNDVALDNLQTAAQFAKPEEPYSCGVLRDLAVVQFLQKESQAADSIGRALTCNPRDEKSLLVSARLRLIAEENRNAEKARDEAAAAEVFAGGKNGFIKRYLALAHLRLKRFDEAIAYAKGALELGDMKTYNQLIIAVAEANQQHTEAAKSASKEAQDSWPEGLKEAGEYDPSAEKGFLWFESADELWDLRSETDRLLAPASGS
jgi:tetratricopeptide (TPR) repeat protein